MADGTNDLLRDLQTNPAKWKKTPGVVLFRAHVRDTRDGQIRVSDKDLPRIANEANAMIADTGKLTTFTLGHRKFGDVDEKKAPPLIGFHLNYRAEPVTRQGKTFLAVVADEYAAVDKAAEFELYRKYPFRSCEYHPSVGIQGVAALQQDPWLNLGTVYEYQQVGADNPPICYQTEPIPMADQNTPNTPAPGGDDVDPGMYAAWMKCMQKYMASAGGAMGATNGGTPAPVGQQPTKYQATGVDKTVAELQKTVADLTAKNVKTTCERLLDPIRQAVKFDYQRELTAMTNYQSDADRESHVKYMIEHYEKLPFGGMIETYQGSVKPQGLPGSGPQFDPITVDVGTHEKIKKYQVDHGCTYAEAAGAVVKA